MCRPTIPWRMRHPPKILSRDSPDMMFQHPHKHRRPVPPVVTRVINGSRLEENKINRFENTHVRNDDRWNNGKSDVQKSEYFQHVSIFARTVVVPFAYHRTSTVCTIITYSVIRHPCYHDCTRRKCYVTGRAVLRGESGRLNSRRLLVVPEFLSFTDRTEEVLENSVRAFNDRPSVSKFIGSDEVV